MPFFQPPKLGKSKCSSGAYKAPAYISWDTLLGGAVLTRADEIPPQPPQSPTANPVDMRRKQQKPSHGDVQDSRDISTMLQKSAPSKMAAGESGSTRNTSDRMEHKGTQATLMFYSSLTLLTTWPTMKYHLAHHANAARAI
ncbi:Hypothetical predicted protein [Pelobates cultripes]|uniref:Uncharacterized protein n=1 Tax=Pelobates cultripes TaxID=61616 RepID=A0AAD1TG81_PELCU|nr:Hypothetical predicted protein [Pelobates cultripes]